MSPPYIWWNLATLSSVIFLAGRGCNAVTFQIPESRPPSAAELDQTPVAISIEFFAYPAYTNLTTTHQCLTNLAALTSHPVPLRIGGTTQDRATFNSSLKTPVSYTVPSPTTAPSNLTFGPEFIKLAGRYEGEVILGLNRGHDDLENTILAAREAVGRIGGLRALEVGNEPDLYLSDGQAIATNTGTWTPLTDAISEQTWQIAVGGALNKTRIIQAGNFVSNPPEWGAAELISAENASAFQYIKEFSHHDYPQSGGLNSTTVNLTLLMNHQSIVDNVAVYVPDVVAANAAGFEYVMGETNSVSGGGAFSISGTFGAALWLLDYTLRATSVNIKRLYFHHGTIGACAYCFFTPTTTTAPYYGAYFATLTLSHATHILPLDNGTSPFASYLIYRDATPIRALFINTNFLHSSPNSTVASSDETFVLTGLESGLGDGLGLGYGNIEVKAKRFTAPSATAEQDVTFGGQWFVNETCGIVGEEVFEDVVVRDDGGIEVVVRASEAVLVYL